MPRGRVVLLGVAVLAGAVLVAGVLVARDSGPAVATSSSGPRLTLSGAHPVTGEPVSLEQFEGKPVLVNVWASWCPGCHDEAEALARVAAEHPEVGVLGIDFNDTRAAARDFYDRYGWTFPSIFDPDGKLAFELGLQGMPTTIVLDDEHREVARIVGEANEAGFREAIARISS